MGKEKMIRTPVGNYPINKDTALMLDGMSDIELLQAYVQNYERVGFVEPFLFSEMMDRKLVQMGELHRDILKKLEAMKNASITRTSDGIILTGHVGTWYVIDSKLYGKEMLYLLEHETLGDDAPTVIVKSDGTIVLEDVWNGFDDLFWVD
jgi:hypothetical protein